MRDPEDTRAMKDVPKPYARFGAQFPAILAKNEELGTFVHEHGGPIDEKTRWLIKLGISAASRHQTGVTTHAKRARQAGATDAEILHALLLVIPTCGFPTFMEAYNQLQED